MFVGHDGHVGQQSKELNTFLYSIMWLFLTFRGKIHPYVSKHILQWNKAFGLLLAMKNELNLVGRLCHTDMNICLLRSHALAELSHVRGTSIPAQDMWQGMPWEATLP
jgi:hypothetical protein